MPTAVAGPEIERLISCWRSCRGWARSARRAALHLIKKREMLMAPLTGALQTAMDKIVICKTCGNIDTKDRARSALDPRRDQSIIVVSPMSPTCGARSGRMPSTAAITCSVGTLSALDGRRAAGLDD